MAPSRQKILQAALVCFDQNSYEASTTAAICKASGVSNGSFFHHFGSKEGLAAQLFLSALCSYHDAVLDGLSSNLDVEAGLRHLIAAHVGWVSHERQQAQFLFEQSRAQWMSSIKEEQAAENKRFADGIKAWRAPLLDAGKLPEMADTVFFSLVIGPAQMLARQWLASRSDNDLKTHIPTLGDFAVAAFNAASNAPQN